MKAFEPFRIGKLELKNRLVVSAMVTNYCNPDGTPTEKYLAYHEHKAQGGWGLIITEDYAIAPKAGGFTRLPGLWEGSQIQPHQELTRRVHQAGGKIVAQIYHAGRETSSAITGERPVGPSPIREPSMPETPRELTVEEIHQLVEQFGDCARRAQQAGFDGVEVHGAHGYLVGGQGLRLALCQQALRRVRRHHPEPGAVCGGNHPEHQTEMRGGFPRALSDERRGVRPRRPGDRGGQGAGPPGGRGRGRLHPLLPGGVRLHPAHHSALCGGTGRLCAERRRHQERGAYPGDCRGPHQRHPGGGEHFAVRPGRFGHHGPGLFGGPGDAQENPRGPGGRGAAVHRLPAGLRRRKRQRPLCPLPGEPPDGHGGRVRLLSHQGAQAGAGHWRGACPGARRPSPRLTKATG